MRAIVIEKSQTGYHIHKHFIFPMEPHPQSLAALVVMTNYYRRKDPEVNPYTRWKIFRKKRREVLSEHFAKNQKYICYYCGRTDLINDSNLNSPQRVTIDHFIPISRGGSLLNKTNMVVACSKCNNEKSDKLLW